MALITLNDFYTVDNSTNDVKIELKIGAIGQKGLSSLNLANGKFNKENVKGNLSPTSISKNKDLDMMKLTILTTIADTSKQTNNTNLEIILTGGLNKKTYSLNRTVDAEGDSADYICVIQFIEINN